MNLFIRTGLWVLAGLFVITTGLYLYLRNANLSVYEDAVEEALSEAFGHEFRIDGLFELRFATLTTVTAEQVSIANPNWDPEPMLLSVGRISVAVDTWSLVRNPIIIESLEIADIELRFSKNDVSQSNWASENRKQSEGQSGEFDPELIAFKDVGIENFRMVYSDPARRRPTTFSIERLVVSPDPNDVLDLDLTGSINEFPLWADGKLGPWQSLLDGRNVISELDLTLGQVRLSLGGSVADVANLEGVELVVDFTGPAIERLADTLGFPPFAEGEFAVEGQVRRLDNGNQIRLTGNLGAVDVYASGNLDRLLRPQTADLDFNFSGPDTKYVAEVFGVKGAPEAPFTVTGDLKKVGTRFQFTEARAQLGENALEVEGWLDVRNPIPDGEISLLASGPDFSVIGPFAGIEGIPSETFKIGGLVQKTGSNWRIDDVEVTIGENRITANGAFADADTEINLHASGPDVSVLHEMTGLDGLPDRPFDVQATIQPDRNGLRIDNARGVFGENQLNVDGVIGTRSGLSGTILSLRAAGPELGNVALLTGVPNLPTGAFEILGRIRIDNDLLYIDNATADVQAMSASAVGTVGLATNIGEFDLEISANGPDLGMLLQNELSNRLAGQPFTVNGRVVNRDGEYGLHAINALVGNLSINVDGDFVTGGESIDLTISASAPDSNILGVIAGEVDFPDGALTAGGRIQVSSSDIEFADMEASVGEFRFAADGTLSNSPLQNESDLRFSVSGPDMKQLFSALGFDGALAKPYSVSGEVNGTPTGFALEALVARVGDNDVNGFFTADLRDKPVFTGALTSTFLNLTERLAQAQQDSEETESIQSEFLFSDTPIEPDLLDSVDVDVSLNVDHLIVNQADVSDVRIGIRLEEGALSINPIEFRESAGSIAGQFQLVPDDGLYTLKAELDVDNWHVGPLASEGQERSTLPPFTGLFELNGTGRSMHQIMASANGKLAFTQGSGQVKAMLGSRLFGDLVLEVLRTFNPIRNAEEFTNVECAIYDVVVTDGVATVQNLALQTDKLTIVSQGNINFENEALNLTMRAKPREGIGISLGGVANSLLKLGGTLRKPQMGIDATGTMTTTGAAVATGGLSLLARGLWDRVSAEADICKDLNASNEE